MHAEPSHCHPLTLTRRIEDFPIANLPLVEHQRMLTAGTGLAVHPHAWIARPELEAFLTSDAAAMVDAAGQPLLWRGEAPAAGETTTAVASFMIRHPWDFLRANEAFVSALAQPDIRGEVHPSAVIEGVLHLGAGTRILPGVFIEGNVVIGENCKIGPNCYLRGSTSIGPGCHVGQAVELKNCVILARTSVGHLSYVGDSVLGEGVNFGAGTITSNLRHDGRNHRSAVDGTLVDTGRRKFGAIIGDRVHTGIHTAIYPGRKLWPGVTTRPGEIVQRDLVPGD